MRILDYDPPIQVEGPWLGSCRIGIAYSPWFQRIIASIRNKSRIISYLGYIFLQVKAVNSSMLDVDPSPIC